MGTYWLYRDIQVIQGIVVKQRYTGYMNLYRLHGVYWLCISTLVQGCPDYMGDIQRERVVLVLRVYWLYVGVLITWRYTGCIGVYWFIVVILVSLVIQRCRDVLTIAVDTGYVRNHWLYRGVLFLWRYTGCIWVQLTEGVLAMTLITQGCNHFEDTLLIQGGSSGFMRVH